MVYPYAYKWCTHVLVVQEFEGSWPWQNLCPVVLHTLRTACQGLLVLWLQLQFYLYKKQYKCCQNIMINFVHQFLCFKNFSILFAPLDLQYWKETLAKSETETCVVFSAVLSLNQRIPIFFKLTGRRWPKIRKIYIKMITEIALKYQDTDHCEITYFYGNSRHRGNCIEWEDCLRCCTVMQGVPTKVNLLDSFFRAPRVMVIRAVLKQWIGPCFNNSHE